MNIDDNIRQLNADVSLLTRVCEKNTKEIERLQKQINALLSVISLIDTKDLALAATINFGNNMMEKIKEKNKKSVKK